jgi:hypothetical protein
MPRGGARPGAGRPRTRPRPVKVGKNCSPLEFMLAIANDPEQPAWWRDRMAKVAAEYLHGKGGGEETES